jgi:hypothetical protein
MDPVDITGRLKALPLFAGLPIEELEWLTAHAQYQEEAGAIVARRECIEIWIVLSEPRDSR